MKKFKVIIETQCYLPHAFDEGKYGALPEKYWDSNRKYKSFIKNDTIGTIDLEFNHPDGYPMVIFKVDGYEDRYHFLAKSAIGDLSEKSHPSPKINWNNLPKQSKLKEIILTGKIETEEKIIKFEINRKRQILNKKNEFVYKYKMSPGHNSISYHIKTNNKNGVFETVFIEHVGNLHEEIFDSLVKNQLFKFPKEELEEDSVSQIKSFIKSGEFFVNPNSSFTYFYIHGDSKYLVHKENAFKTHFSRISKGLEKRGCKISIGKEFFTLSGRKNKENEFANYIIHWVEINDEKVMIFDGNADRSNYFYNFIDKLMEITEEILNKENRQEKAHLIGCGDGYMICLLSNEDFDLFKKICEPLHILFDVKSKRNLPLF